MLIKRSCQRYWRVNVAEIVTKVRVAISTEERRSPWQPTHGPPPGTCQVKSSVCNEFLPKMQVGSGREEEWEGDKPSKVTVKIEPKHMTIPLQTSPEIYPLHLQLSLHISWWSAFCKRYFPRLSRFRYSGHVESSFGHQHNTIHFTNLITSQNNNIFCDLFIRTFPSLPFAKRETSCPRGTQNLQWYS